MASDPAERESLTGAELWREGALFHRFKRHVTAPDGRTVDRLRQVLADGLLAPAHDPEGNVIRDFTIEVVGTDVPYDSVIFIHRFQPGVSHIYTTSHDREDVFIFLDESVPVTEPEAVSDGWPRLCQDEVVSADPIPPERITALMVPDSQAPGVLEETRALLEARSIALYGTSGRRFA